MRAFQTSVSTTFVPDCLKYETMFCGLIFDSDEFWGDALVLWAKSFVQEQKFANFHPALQFMCTEMYKVYVITIISCTARMSLICCGVEGSSFVL